MNIKRYIFFTAIFLILASESYAQGFKIKKGEPVYEIGASLYLNTNYHFTGNFNIPDIATCCETPKSGFGYGLAIGALFEYKLDDQFGIGFQGLFRSSSGYLTSIEEEFVDAGNGQLIQADIEHSFDAEISNINLFPYLSYRITSEIRLNGGPIFGLISTPEYRNEEYLSEPNNVTFETGSRSRNILTGDLDNSASLLYGISIGGVYDLPLDNDGTFILTPEVNFSFYFNSVSNDIPWNIITGQVGASLRFIKHESIKIYDYVPVPAPLPGVPDPISPPLLSGDIDLYLTDESGNLSDDNRIIIEKTIEISSYAPLNYVFFDSLSSDIPDRFVILTKEEADNFDIHDLNGLNKLDVYYQLLNIVGKRMKDYSSSEITLTGTNSNTGAEENNLKLSEERSLSIANYLHEVWGISLDRLKTRTRNLPSNPSNNLTTDGLEENRRVEITTDDPFILESLFFIDTVNSVLNQKLIAEVKEKSDAGIDHIEYRVIQGNDTVYTKILKNDIPDKFPIDLAKREILDPNSEEPLRALVKIEDKAGQELILESDLIQVEHFEKRKNKVETYSLVIFGFNTAEMDEDNRKVIDKIKSNTNPDATIKVKGYADRSGLLEYNKELSLKRALAVSNQLGISPEFAEGIGNEVLLYNNDLPEGRFYSRTVVITVETPLE